MRLYTRTSPFTFLKLISPLSKELISSFIRPAVSGPTRISPPAAADAIRAARLVTDPLAVNVIRVPAAPRNFVIPTEAIPELIPMFTWIGSKSSLQLLPDLDRPRVDVERGPCGIESIFSLCPLEDNHETVSGGLIDVSLIRVNDVQKTGEILFNNEIHLLLREPLTDLRVTREVQEKDRDIHIALLKERRNGVLFN